MFQIKKIIFSISLVLFITVGFCFGLVMPSNTAIAQASFLDIIRALVTINPLEIEVTAPVEVSINKVFRIETKIINKGQERITNLKAEIVLHPGLALMAKNKVQKAGAIPSQKDKKVQWRIKGEAGGNYFISVLVQGKLKGQEVSAEGTSAMIIILDAEEAGTMITNLDKEEGENKKSPNSPQRFYNLWQDFLSALKDWLNL